MVHMACCSDRHPSLISPPPLTLFLLLQRYAPELTTCRPLRFCDVGCGSGKLVVAAAMLFPFTACCGVEVMGGLHQLAEQLAVQWRQLPCALRSVSGVAGGTAHPTVAMVHGDALSSLHRPPPISRRSTGIHSHSMVSGMSSGRPNAAGDDDVEAGRGGAILGTPPGSPQPEDYMDEAASLVEDVMGQAASTPRADILMLTEMHMAEAKKARGGA